MTFSLVARCAKTGQFGVVISSSSPAVAARCSHVRAGVGAVASQNITDPALGPLLLDTLAAPLRTRHEKTYSAPLATRAYAKETVEVLAADGSITAQRVFPRLRFGGAHLADEAQRADDIRLRILAAELVELDCVGFTFRALRDHVHAQIGCELVEGAGGVCTTVEVNGYDWFVAGRPRAVDQAVALLRG